LVVGDTAVSSDANSDRDKDKTSNMTPKICIIVLAVSMTAILIGIMAIINSVSSKIHDNAVSRLDERISELRTEFKQSIEKLEIDNYNIAYFNHEDVILRSVNKHRDFLKTNSSEDRIKFVEEAKNLENEIGTVLRMLTGTSDVDYLNAIRGSLHVSTSNLMTLHERLAQKFLL
jgi:hypothetical protein